MAVVGAGTISVTDLPPYTPRRQLRGVLRHFGVPLVGMVDRWEEGFRRFHPEVEFADDLSKASALAGLFTGVADLGSSGREPVLTEYFSFWETFHRMPVEIEVATGAVDVKGGSYGLVVFTHESNPIAGLTIEQLDGIFGAERTGGYDGFRWSPGAARGPDKDLRTWGQLGLTGRWAQAPIRTYGFAQTGMAVFFERRVFGGGQKWNPNYREYIEAGTKQVADESLTTASMMRALAHDPYGIAWAGLWHGSGLAGVKPIAIAASPTGRFHRPSRTSFASRDYPLARSIYLFFDGGAGGPRADLTHEYLRYVLSRQGQQQVLEQGVYLPLPAHVAAEQLAKLQACEAVPAGQGEHR